MLISGQGETHLDVLNKKLKAKFNVSAVLKNAQDRLPRDHPQESGSGRQT